MKFNSEQQCRARAAHDHAGAPATGTAAGVPTANNPWEYWGR